MTRYYVVAWLALAGVTCSAQDARYLLVRADAVVFAPKTFRLSGTKVTEPAPQNLPREMDFSLAISRDGRMRNETGSGETLQLDVFDGSSLSTYRARANVYTHAAAKSAPEMPLMRMLRLGSDASNIASARVEREESVNFAGKATACYVVRANYNGAVGIPYASDVVRTAWIARENGIVVRDVWEFGMPPASSTVRHRWTFNFASVEWDTPLPDELFAFHPPAGSQLIDLPMNPSTPGGPVGKMTPPGAVRKTAPEYSAEARAVNLQGNALVTTDVDENGGASNFRIFRGLGLGLDAQALEAVKQWQFTPGKREGRPSRMTLTYAVEFRLPDGGPWRVEGASYLWPDVRRPTPVTRPWLRQYSSPEASACTESRGYAVMRVHIGADGVPGAVNLQGSSTDAAGQAAIRAVQAWAFEPAKADEKPVASDGTILLECSGSRMPDQTAGSDGSMYRVRGGVTAPVPIFKPEPEYSEEARKAKHQGTVVLYIVVDSTGKPKDTAVVRPLGLGLDEKALDAVAQWRFRPGMREGKPVNVAATVEVNFKLL
jgi:TonB family protein